MGKRGPKPKKIVKLSWSPNFAYAIGLLATDGCIAKSGALIDLTSKDREQLDNFNKALRLKVKIGKKKSEHGKIAWRIQIKNRIFYDYLTYIGFTPAKSKTLKKIKVPDEYFFDFLRGCFDGDGSFYSYLDPRWKSSFMFYTEFCSASSQFTDWIQQKNQRLLGIRGHVTKDRKKITYQLKYAKRESSVLLKAMYHSKNLISLSRKRLKMARVFDSIGLSVGHISSYTRQASAQVV